MSICVECLYHDEFEALDLCDNKGLPISEFVHGRRYCDDLNPKGDCKGFKPQAKPESIYESKEGEDLANTANGSPWEPETTCVEHKP